MKALRIVGAVLIVLLVVAGLGYQYLFSRTAVPETSSYTIDREKLPALAMSEPGSLPIRVNHQPIALASLPRAAIFAGESFDPHRMLHGVYQIVYPDGRSVIVDAGFGPEYFETMASEGSQYDARAFALVEAALERAATIVLTHEHGDHIEGLGQVDDPAGLADRVVMNAAQHGNPQTSEVLPAALLDRVEPIAGQAPYVLGPGIVLLPAAGHTPGSQIIYVLTGEGREYLLIGDVAWHMDAIRDLHYRPRVVTDYFLGEDRAAVMDQFRALHGLIDDETIQIVVSHDAEQRRELTRAGVLGDGLE